VYILFDTEIAGFGLRVQPGGSRTWILQYRHEGRKRRVTLGKYPDLTLAQARRLAAERLLLLARGEDPGRVRGAAFGSLCDRYLAEYAPRKKTYQQDVRRVEGRLRTAWGTRRLASITAEDVRRLHDQIGRGAPYEANRILALVKKMFNLAEAWGWTPAGWRNPAVGISKHPERRRDRWVRPEEMPALLAAIAAEPDIYVRAGLLLYLLTGLRKMELMRARWCDLDAARGLLAVGENKASRPFYCSLPEPALRILAELPRLPGCPWVFPGPDPTRHLADFPRRPWRRIRERAGLQDVRIHDLRRTFGSWLTMQGQGLAVVAKALNQSTLSATQIYAHLADDPVRQAVAEHARRLLPDAPQKKIKKK
jgi:integrase